MRFWILSAFPWSLLSLAGWLHSVSFRLPWGETCRILRRSCCTSPSCKFYFLYLLLLLLFSIFTWGYFLTDSTERKTSLWETNIDQLPLIHAPTGGQTYNLGMCPHWELNPEHFEYGTMLHLTEPLSLGYLYCKRVQPGAPSPRRFGMGSRT